MVTRARSSGLPPASRTTASALVSAWSNCAANVFPSFGFADVGSHPICPATNTIRPFATTPLEYPFGRAHPTVFPPPRTPSAPSPQPGGSTPRAPPPPAAGPAVDASGSRQPPSVDDVRGPGDRPRLRSGEEEAHLRHLLRPNEAANGVH